MRTARVAVDGAVHTATPHPNGVQLANGRVIADDQVTWLAPFEVGTIIALGLNYADHVKELAKELTVTAKEAIRRKLQADMEAFLRRGGAVTQVAADEEAYKKMRETARAPDPSEDD